MAWIKTEAGRREMQTRSLVSARTQRNLLVLIDGKCSVQDLCAKVSGATEADFEALRAAALIEFVGTPAATPTGVRAAVSAAVASTPPTPPTPHRADAHLRPPAPGNHAGSGPTYAHLSSTLTRLVSTELGLRGLPLTLAVERAATVDDLRRVADTVIARIRERRGDGNADAARQALFGG